MSVAAPSSLFDQIEAWLRRQPAIRYVRSQSENAGESIEIEAQDEHGFSVAIAEDDPPWWTISVGEHGVHIHAADQEEAERWLHLLLSDACQIEITLGAFSVRGLIREWQQGGWTTVYTYRAFMPRFWKSRSQWVLRNRLVRILDDDEVEPRG